MAGAKENTVEDNEIIASSTGIWLGLFAPGVSSNTVKGNSVTLSVRGIWVDSESTSNTIEANAVLGSRDVDLADMNIDCAANLWADNDFETDLVAGTPDGGPGAGCIR